MIAILSLTTLAQFLLLSLPPSASPIVNLLCSVRFLLVFTVRVQTSVIKADDLVWVRWTVKQNFFRAQSRSSQDEVRGERPMSGAPQAEGTMLQ